MPINILIWLINSVRTALSQSPWKLDLRWEVEGRASRSRPPAVPPTGLLHTREKQKHTYVIHTITHNKCGRDIPKAYKPENHKCVG